MKWFYLSAEYADDDNDDDFSDKNETQQQRELSHNNSNQTSVPYRHHCPQLL